MNTIETLKAAVQRDVQTLKAMRKWRDAILAGARGSTVEAAEEVDFAMENLRITRDRVLALYMETKDTALLPVLAEAEKALGIITTLKPV